MDSVILFADTNAFLQLRDLKDLKWRELFPNVKHVRIMVAKPVIEELGKHKNSGNDRRRNRSRLALNQIAAASKAPDRTLVLKDKPLRITLEIPRSSRPDWKALDELDPISPDDRLVAAAVTYGHGAAIFSHDTGPRITAEGLGLEACEPLEDWHLPAEQTDSDREIALLKRQLEHERSTKPHLEIEIAGRDDAGKLTLYRPLVKPLDSVAVDRLTKRYLDEYRRDKLVGVNPVLAMGFDHHLTMDQVSGYYSDYDDFAERVKKFFQALHEHLPLYLAVPIVRVKITNTGSVSAVNYHVTLETSGGFTLVAEPDDIRKLCPLPTPPKVPRPRSALDPFRHSLLSPTYPKESHPTEMLWIKRPKFGASSGRYGCKDFQPKRVDESEVALWQDDALPVTGVLSITAGANDVADLTESVEVTIEEREEEWQSPSVIGSLPEFLKTEIKALKWDQETYDNLKKKVGDRIAQVNKSRRTKGSRPVSPRPATRRTRPTK